MPAANFPEYARNITDTLNRIVAAGEAVLLTLQVDQRSSTQGFLSGSVQFDNGSILHFREFVNTSQVEPKRMYAYHYQDADANLIFRYDNARHRPALLRSEHKHTPSGVEMFPAPTLVEVLDHILKQKGA
jgi:hypothetical protein